MKKEEIDKKIWFLIIFLLLLWGNNSTVTVIILRNMNQYQMMFFMFLGAVLFTLIRDKGTFKYDTKMTKKDWCFTLFYGLCNFYYVFGYTYGLKYIPTVEATMLNYTFPIFIVIFSVVLFKEKLNFKKVLAILLGFLGVIYLTTNGNIFSFRLSNPMGDFMVLSAAMMWGIFTNMGRMINSNYNFYKFLNLVIGLALSAITVLVMSSFEDMKLVSIIIALCWGILHFYVGINIWVYLSRNLSSSVLANISFITPIIAIFSIVIFLGDKLLPSHIGGGLFIFFAVLLQSRESK